MLMRLGQTFASPVLQAASVGSLVIEASWRVIACLGDFRSRRSTAMRPPGRPFAAANRSETRAGSGGAIPGRKRSDRRVRRAVHGLAPQV
jgi:hypothetical protein